MKEYIERINVLVINEIARKHITFKLNENGLPRIMINNKEAFRADYGYNKESGFIFIEVSVPSVYYDKIELRWWINKNQYSLQTYVYPPTSNHSHGNPYINKSSLADFLMIISIYRAFDSIVDLTFNNTIHIPDYMIRFDYLTRKEGIVNKNSWMN